MYFVWNSQLKNSFFNSMSLSQRKKDIFGLWSHPLILLCTKPHHSLFQLSAPKQVFAIMVCRENQNVLEKWTMAGWSDAVTVTFGQIFDDIFFLLFYKNKSKKSFKSSASKVRLSIKTHLCIKPRMQNIGHRLEKFTYFCSIITTPTSQFIWSF